MVPVTASTEPVDHRRVVIYEPKSNHGNGGNVLFMDGHVSFLRDEAYDLVAREPTRWWVTDDKTPLSARRSLRSSARRRERSFSYQTGRWIQLSENVIKSDESAY